MKFLVVSFLLVAVASARPNSMLRPAMDNSNLLKPAVEEPVYASMHTMARPKIPTLLEALEQTANIHEISRPMIPDFATAIGQLPEVRPLPIEQPSIMPLPIELPSIMPLPVEMPSIGVQPLPEIEAPATKPLVQIFVNVADPSLVEVIGPETPAIGNFPLMPVVPSGPVGTFPELDLTKPSVVPEINTFPLMPVFPSGPVGTFPELDLTKPSEVHEINTFPLMPVFPSGPVGTFPEIDLTKPSVVPEINTFPLMPVFPAGPVGTFPEHDLTKPSIEVTEDLTRPVIESILESLLRPSEVDNSDVFRPATSLIR